MHAQRASASSKPWPPGITTGTSRPWWSLCAEPDATTGARRSLTRIAMRDEPRLWGFGPTPRLRPGVHARPHEARDDVVGGSGSRRLRERRPGSVQPGAPEALPGSFDAGRELP